MIDGRDDEPESAEAEQSGGDSEREQERRAGDRDKFMGSRGFHGFDGFINGHWVQLQVDKAKLRA